MAQETIFVQTDPSFDIVHNSLKELKDRSKVTYVKTVSIKNIESDNDEEAKKNKFGGLYGFTRTASVIARMCMLTATNIPKKLWPIIGNNSSSRNELKLVEKVNREGNFKLADNDYDAEKYWSKYDQQYPHYVMKHKIKSVEMGNQISLPSMVLIVRNDLTKAIEITTKLDATRKTENEYDSFVHVFCIVRSIQPLPQNQTDGRFTELLKELMLKEPKHLINTYVDDIKKAITKEDWNCFPVPSNYLKIEENENEGLQEQQQQQ